MRNFRVVRRRSCLQCGSHKLIKKKVGSLRRRYTCKECDLTFSGFKLFRLRFSWR